MIRPLLWLPLAALSLGPAVAQEETLEKQVRKLHALAAGTWCEPVEGGYVPEDDYLSWTIDYTPSWNEGGEPEQVTLIRIFCGAGAYNLQHAYYWYREYEGLQPLAFAEPTYETEYENDDIDGTLLGVTVTGMGTASLLVNSEFDPETATITATAFWRGIGDASSSGTWVFKDGAFSLVRYEIDASYDGEVNPETVLDYSAED